MARIIAARSRNRAGLYGEIGGMRLPQFSEDMLPVQQLALESFNFGELLGGDILSIWGTPKKDASGSEYLPINIVLEQVNTPFINVINRSFAQWRKSRFPFRPDYLEFT